MKTQVILVFCAILVQQLYGSVIIANEPENAVKNPNTIPSEPATNSIKNVNRPVATVQELKLDAENLQKALSGSEVSSGTVITILTSRTHEQRLEIARQFKTMFNQDLVEEFKNKLSGEFKNLAVALIKPTPQFLADELHNAIEGSGTDEECLIDVLCTLNNQEMKAVCDAYQKTYGVTLASDIQGDTSGYFAKLLTTLTEGKREENKEVNRAEAAEDAAKLFEAGEKKWGTDEDTFISLLTTRSNEHLKQTFDEYQNLSGNDIAYAIKCEFSSFTRQALLALVNSIRNLADFFADRLNSSLEGSKTINGRLTRIMTTMDNNNGMQSLKSHYKKSYGKSLKKAIGDDTDGEYKECLMALAGED